MQPRDLNRIVINSDGNYGPSRGLADYTQSSADRQTTVYFRDLENHLIEYIQQASVVVGCVAWLTNIRILKSLANVSGCVAIVVQKEDFLRPDIDSTSDWSHKLRLLYSSLPSGPDRYHWPGLIGQLSVLGDPAVEAVRCVGNYNRERSPAFPRMHHKFLVFCRSVELQTQNNYSFAIEPYAVWTGSFNLTQNANMSLENALVLTDTAIVQSYYQEWEQIESISEELDWTTDWSAPEWRIGT